MRFRQAWFSLAAGTVLAASFAVPSAFAEAQQVVRQQVNIVTGEHLWGSGHIETVSGQSFLDNTTAVGIISHLLDDQIRSAGESWTITTRLAHPFTTSSSSSRGPWSVEVDRHRLLSFTMHRYDGKLYVPMASFLQLLSSLGALTGWQKNVLTVFPDVEFNAAAAFYRLNGERTVYAVIPFPNQSAPKGLAIPFLSSQQNLQVAIVNAKDQIANLPTKATSYAFSLPVSWAGGNAIWIAGVTRSQTFDLTLLEGTSTSVVRVGEFSGSNGVVFYTVNGELDVVESNQGPERTLANGTNGFVIHNDLYEIQGRKALPLAQFDTGQLDIPPHVQAPPSWDAYAIVTTMIQSTYPATIQVDLEKHFLTRQGFFRHLLHHNTDLQRFLAYQFPIISLLSRTVNPHTLRYELVADNETLTVTLSLSGHSWELSNLVLS